MVIPKAAGVMLAVLLAGPAARAADWNAAGGGIFVARASAPRADDGPAPARLPAPTQPLQAAIDAAAARHRLDPKLLRALVVVESGYRADAVSPAGAGGLTQLMPATARALGVADRFDPAANLAGGADFLARQLLRFGDVRLALAAYNAGPERVARLGRIPQIRETQDYVEAVVSCFLVLAAGRAVHSVADCRGVGS